MEIGDAWFGVLPFIWAAQKWVYSTKVVLNYMWFVNLKLKFVLIG